MANAKRTRAMIILVATGVVVLAAIIFICVVIYESLQGVSVDSTTDLGQQVCDAGQKIKNAAVYPNNKSAHMYLGVESPVIQEKPLLTDYDSIADQVEPDTTYKIGYLALNKLSLLNGGDVTTTSLVGCVKRTSEVKTSQTCKYDTGTLQVYKATYILTVYEAKTHKQVKTQEIATVPQSEFPCPTSIHFDPRVKKEYIPMKASELLKAVQDLVQV